MSSIKDLSPVVVWNNFYSLTQIPRPSKHEEKVSKFLYDWGVAHGLETHRDEVGNIIMRKPATPGFEDCKGVILQGHMDMVPAKASDSKHDFLKDPIPAYIDGDWIRTHGTTLGSDNGIGLALAMAVLESKDLQHGPIEALFTIDEEQGMTGARAISPDALKGDILINLDEELEGSLCVGCAGGVNVTATKKYKPATEVPEGYTLYTLAVDKLNGGHSGADIKLGRANANKVVLHILHGMLEDLGCLLVSFDGGELRNAIPVKAEAKVLVPKLTEKAVKKHIDELFEWEKAEYKISDPNAELTFKSSKAKVTEYVKPNDALKFVKALIACPSGVERMSEVIKGLTETSTNMAIVKIEGGNFFVKSLTRSSVDSAKNKLAIRQQLIFELIGCKVKMDGGYNGWKPNNDSEILAVCKDVYRKLRGEEVNIMATHGGLECGIFGGSYPHWDMIAMGPTLEYPHSISEQLYIPSVGRTWEFLCEILKNIPKK